MKRKTWLWLALFVMALILLMAPGVIYWTLVAVGLLVLIVAGVTTFIFGLVLSGIVVGLLRAVKTKGRECQWTD